MKNLKNYQGGGNLTALKAFYLYAFIFLFFGTMVTTYTSFAQTPNIITYQGKLTHQGTDVSGERTITARLYANAEGTQKVWEGTYKTYVTDGIFALPLGAGKYPLPAPTKLDKQLWVGITVDGVELRPLTQLTSSPYALNVADKSITKAKLADDVLLRTLGGQTQQWIGFGGCLYDSNDDGNPDFTTNVVVGGCGNYTLPPSSGSASPGYASILGGYHNRVYGAYSTIVGGQQNSIGWAYTNSSYFNSSGIFSGEGNRINSSFSFIGGGKNNKDSADYSVISGGEADTVIGEYGVIGGGKYNVADTYGFIGGGKYNVAGAYGFIGGGSNNKSIGYFGSVGGGINNFVDSCSSVPGGINLKLGKFSFGFNADNTTNVTNLSTYSKTAYFGNVDLYISNVDNKARQLRFYEPSTNSLSGYGFQPGLIGHYTAFQSQSQDTNIIYTLPDTSGSYGSVLTNYGNDSLFWGPGLLNGGWLTSGNIGTIAGQNYLGTKDSQAVEIHVFNNGDSIQGYRRVMRYEPLPNSPNIIGGFNGNRVTSSTGSVISGGGKILDSNIIQFADYSVIAGGRKNSIALDRDGNEVAHFSVIGGGYNNRIETQSHMSPEYSQYVTIAGGKDNLAADQGTFIGGGDGNYAVEDYSVITGGQFNTTTSIQSFIGGGLYNFISGTGSTLVGGRSNSAPGLLTFIGGGADNQAIGSYSSIPGGQGLIANGQYQTALGKYNMIINPPYLVIGNGQDPTARSNAYEVYPQGHSIVYHNNTMSTNPAIKGARYIDNTPIAWGKVDAAGILQSGFGITSVTFVPGPPPHYLIKLNYVDSYSGGQVQIANGNSIVATINDESGEDGNHQCIFINVGKLKWVNGLNEFRVFTSVQGVQAVPLQLTCNFIPFGFNFVVFGRPTYL